MKLFKWVGDHVGDLVDEGVETTPEWLARIFLFPAYVCLFLVGIVALIIGIVALIKGRISKT